MRRVVDRDEAVQLVREVIAEKGEETRAGCTYAYPDGTPCCIVGHVLYRLGEDIAALPDIRIGSKPSLMHIKSVDFTHAALAFLTHLQDEQDAGENWGTALESAFEQEPLAAVA